MNKFTINTVYPSKTDSMRYNISYLTNDNNKEFINNFNPEDIIERKRFKKEKIINCYEEILNDCLKKVNDFSENDKYDLIYGIPSYIQICKNFNLKDCMNYLENKLNEKYFDTYIIKNCKIFITWKYLENNINEMHNQE